MNISGIQNGLMGMALFDMYMGAVKKCHECNKENSTPLVTAACKAFESYLRTEEIGHQAQIAAVATYALNPGGQSVSPVSSQQMAPFLALNILA